MRHTGTVFLSRTPPQASMASCGVFQLQMLVYDRLSTHHIEPWRVTWNGLSAKRFWDDCAPALIPGAAMVMELEQARIHALDCRPPRTEMHASVVSCALVPARSREVVSA